MTQIAARSWHAVVEHEGTGFDQVFENALINLATLQANEHLDELEAKLEEGEEIPEEMRPAIEDPDEVIHMVVEGQKPAWWPRILDRLQIKITIRPNGTTPDPLTPHPLDPNNRDLGRTHFNNILKSLLESAGTPFEGSIQIQITRIKGKAFLNGWRGEIYVGEKLKKKRGRDAGEDAKDEMFDLMQEEHRRAQDAMHRMFGNASNVIHASGAALNAARGVNAPPPWMQGEEGDMPMWMMLANTAMQMVVGAGMQGQNPGQGAMQAGMQAMQHPVQRPGAIGGYQQPQLPGPGMQNQLGYNQYMQGQMAPAQDGEYDGFDAHEDDLVDDGFDDEDYFEHGDEDPNEYYYDEDEEDEENEDEEDEEDEEEDERPRRRRRGRSSGNPLDGMSPADIQAALGDYIDKNQDKKAELQQLGMGLASKLMR